MNKFMSGAIWVLSMDSLNQDMIGKDKLLEIYEFIWIDWRITVPLAIIGLIVSFILYYKE